MRYTIILAAVIALFLCSPAIATPGLRSGFVTTSDGVQLHYLESGKGPAIIFIPGWTMPAEIWKPQLLHFAQEFHVIALDPRSHGLSEKTNEGHYPERMARDIEETLRHLNIADAVFVAWSMAVPQVLTYVQRFGAARIRALILVDGFVSIEQTLEQTLGFLNSMIDLQRDRRKYVQSFVRSMFKRPHPERYIHDVIAASLKMPTNSAVAMVAGFLTQGDQLPIIRNVNRPLLYLATEQKQRQAELIKSNLPTARVEIVEGVGHAMFIDDPQLFNRKLSEFIHFVK